LPIINFSDNESSANIDTKYCKGKFKELFSGKEINVIQDQTHFIIQPWQDMIFVKLN